MCATSMIGDYYKDTFQKQPWFPNMPSVTVPAVPITRAEFDDLKRQVGEMVELLKRAKDYDARNNEPECEMDEKMDLLRRVAKLVGVNLDEALKPKTA